MVQQTCTFPLQFFLDALGQWRSRGQRDRRLLASAGLKDGLALIESAPSRLECVLPIEWGGRRVFIALYVATRGFLLSHFIPTFSEMADACSSGLIAVTSKWFHRWLDPSQLLRPRGTPILRLHRRLISCWVC